MTENVQPAEKPAFPRSRAMPRPRTVAIALIILLLALAWAIYWWTTARWMMATDDALVQADIVTLAPRVSGYLTEVTVEDNQRVTAGQRLARIDSAPYQARVSEAEAALNAAAAERRMQQARMDTLDARRARQNNRIDEAEAAVRAAAAEAGHAAREERRQRRLAGQHVNSAQQEEAAGARMQQTAAMLARAQAMLAAARQELQILASERRSAAAGQDKAAAQQEEAQARLNAARVDLASTQITSPIAGTVGARTLRRGQYVETGAPLLAVVPDDIYAIANFKETQIAQMRIGQPAEIAVDAFDGRRYRGRVDSFAPASGAQFALLPPDNATGNFTKIVQRMPVKIRLESGQAATHDVRPGMSVLVSVDTRHD